jgi:ribosomal protein S18 acetylase RimI-like enzyme
MTGEQTDQIPQVVLEVPSSKEDALDSCVEVHSAQQERRATLDVRLPTLSDSELYSALDALIGTGMPVVASVDGTPLACAFPSVETYPPHDDGLAYFRQHTGTARGLAVHAESAHGRAALGALVRDLVPRWRADGAEGAKISWPVADFNIADELASAGIKPDAYVAYRSANRLSVTSDLGGVLLRSAGPSDLDAAVALNAMVLDEHIAVSPFARQVPGVTERFARRFVEAIEDPSTGHSIVFVAEVAGRVVAMAECEIERAPAHLDATFPPNTIGYVHVFGVEREFRRRGIGTALGTYAIEQLHTGQAVGVRLLVSHYNTVSRQFWTWMGFDEVWRLFQTHELAES